MKMKAFEARFCLHEVKIIKYKPCLCPTVVDQNLLQLVILSPYLVYQDLQQSTLALKIV